jgi:hypothetical protein
VHKRYANKGKPLGHLIEECGEVIQVAGKIQRFGWRAKNPLKGRDRRPNEELLQSEIADLQHAINRVKRSRRWR